PQPANRFSPEIPMIIVLKPDSTEGQIEHVLERIRDLGFKAHVSRGQLRTIVGVVGDEDKLQAEPLSAIPGVEQVLPILKPFKFASREFHAADSVIEVGTGVSGVRPVRIGGGSLVLIAGPCAVEGREVLDTIAGQVKSAGANLLRGGAFKPRTSPYSFQGLGEAGLRSPRGGGPRPGPPAATAGAGPPRGGAGGGVDAQ